MKNFVSFSMFIVSVILNQPSFAAVEIDFEDVLSDGANLTTRYQSLGVRLDSISNPYPLLGVFPSPDALPDTVGDVVTWRFIDNPELGVSAVSTGAETGNNGILMSFDFDIASLSLQGIDLGFFYGSTTIRDEDEAVTLTAYNSSGLKIGSVFSTVNLEGPFDITPASISFPNMRYVAFNYTGNSYGFYALDKFSFTSAVPEPSSALLLMAGLGIVVLMSRKQTSAVN